MKKSILSTLAMVALLISFTSCKDKAKESDATPTEDVIVEEVIVEEVDADDTADDTEVIEVTEEDVVATESASTSSSHASSKEEGSDVIPKDDETVVVSYTYKVMGKEVSGSKTFMGHQKEVEAAVKKLSDSLKRVDPNIVITTK
ncbi:hypothetical protein [Tamlana sp. I1]|uniref:hypothetical protein n=1 Tax=Tamlana sp. I1 TaxID=2762061 RepID=UPI00188F28A5|nr:hypothetical protein [Tamlana sp. I1]